MPAKGKEALTKLKTAILGLNKTLRIAIAVVLVLAVGLVIWLAVRGNSKPKPYTVLFTGLSSEDMTAVQSFMENNDITDYKVEGGNTITVPTEREPTIRAMLVKEKYPTSGFGYTRYLNNVGALSSNSDREVLFLFDLQDRLGATIRCIEGVQEATVFITQSQNTSYILNPDEKIEARATIIVEMKDGKDLPEDLANSIRTMVTTAVQDLEFENITIGDTNGHSYTGEITTDDTSIRDASDLKLALEKQVNEALEQNVLDVLVPMYGEGNVGVSVSSTVDVSRSYNDSTTYEEPAWAADGSTNGEGIIGTKIYDNRVTMNEEQVQGGVVGTATNADLNEYVERYQPDGTERELMSSGEINYNVDTYHEQRENLGGVVTDVMVAVTVNTENGERADALALRAHVARAARIGPELEAEKVSVLMGPFYREQEPEETDPMEGREETEGLPVWYYIILFIGIIVFILLLVLIIYLRKRARIISRQRAEALAEKRRLEAEAAAAIMAEQLQGDRQGADIMDLHSERSMELRMNVRQFAEENPEICAQMVKSWLKGGEDGG